MDSAADPLIRAARQGTRAAVNRLLAAGASVAPWAGAALDDAGTTLLHLACAQGLAELVTALIQAGADVNGADHAGTRPLHAALREGHLKIAQALIAQGATLDGPDSLGNTPLHYAVRKAPALTRLLLARGVTVDPANHEGATPLHGAAEEGTLTVLRALLAQGADPQARAADGATPLHRATIRGRREAAQVLLAHGADPLRRTHAGLTALDIAIHQDKQLLTGLLLTATLQALAPPIRSWPATTGYSPLHQAVYSNKLPFARQLLDKGHRPDTLDDIERTPLHYAAAQGYPDLATLLIAHGVPIDPADRYGRTPLHYAAEAGHAPLVALLLAHRADPAARTATGHTALQYATLHEHAAVVRALLDHGAAPLPADAPPIYEPSAPGELPCPVCGESALDLDEVEVLHGNPATPASDTDMAFHYRCRVCGTRYWTTRPLYTGPGLYEEPGTRTFSYRDGRWKTYG